MTNPLHIQASEHLWQWLHDQDISLALTTYQSNRLFFIGRALEPGRLAVHERLFDKPMGLYRRNDVLTLATRYQIWQLGNRLHSGETHRSADRLYVPRQSWTTGDLNVHDVVLDADDRIVFVNTDFSCLAALNPDYSFEPLWQPPFISKLAAEDRCHLNGLALCDGQPSYMTACSATDEPAGWRNHRLNGGIVLHVPSNSIIAAGLSMPHSPRWHQGKLWLLNSGSGELGYLDPDRFVPVAFCPGFVRGLAFAGDYAIVGLSQLRSSSFGGLQLQERLAQHGQQAQCGLMIIDLNSGETAHWLHFNSLVEELFDIVTLPGVRQPRALGLQDDDIERLVNFPGSHGLITTKPTAQRPPPTKAPVAGLPRSPMPVADIQYQRVFHLTPDNLAAYDRMTYPSLQQRWQSQPPRGELFGVSASIDGDMLGFAIADTLPSGGAELISWFVLPDYRRQGIGSALLKHLQALLGMALQPVRETTP